MTSRTGDLDVESDQYSDYREELISQEEYAQQVGTYRTLAGLPTDGQALVNYLHDRLHAKIKHPFGQRQCMMIYTHKVRRSLG